MQPECEEKLEITEDVCTDLEWRERENVKTIIQYAALSMTAKNCKWFEFSEICKNCGYPKGKHTTIRITKRGLRTVMQYDKRCKEISICGNYYVNRGAFVREEIKFKIDIKKTAVMRAIYRIHGGWVPNGIRAKNSGNKFP